MLVSEIISKIKRYYRGLDHHGNPIDETVTRDKVLYGNPNIECTGITVTCFASYRVIEEAINQGHNLIISHEALFWNHGDHTDWLQDNQIYQKKQQLLKEHNIVVWRNHDYIHSGMPIDDYYVDGIFYGVIKQLGWEQYVVESKERPLLFKLPGLQAEAIAKHLIKAFNLNGLRVIGDLNTVVNSIYIPGHIMGNDNATITKIDQEGIDAVMALELIDYTVSEYIRDAAYAKIPKVIFSVGHFNLEEPGMAYMTHYLPQIINNVVPVSFIASSDAYQYVI